MSNYVPLKLANIDDQQFLPTVEEKFREVQERLARYAQKHQAKAIGAKATLTVKLTLLIEKTEDPSIKAEIETKVPSDPAHMATAWFGHDEHGPCVQIEKISTHEGPSRQRTMFTPDGRVVDPNTGEIKDPAGDENPRPEPLDHDPNDPERRDGPNKPAA